MNIIPIRILPLMGAVLGSCLLTGSASAQATSSIHVDLSKPQVAVAEPFELTITVEAPQDVAVGFPPAAERLGVFDVLSVRDHFDIPMETGRQWIRRYELETIQTGDHEIPAFEVAHTNRRDASARKGILTSKPAKVAVVSSLAADETTENFRDIKNAVLLDVPQPWLNGWRLAGLGGIAVVFGSAAFLYWQWRRPMTPRQWALRSLDGLETIAQTQRENREWIYESAANIIRDYMHRRLGLSAPWLTTQEFFVQLRDDRRMTDAMRARLERFMNSADMVKFAALCCDQTFIKHALDEARAFVVQCDEDLQASDARVDVRGSEAEVVGTL